MAESKFFNNNINKLFTVDNLSEGFFGDGSRKNKEVLEIKEEVKLLDVEELDLSEEIKLFKKNTYSTSASSTCSSRLSNTDSESEEEEFSSGSESEYSDEEDEIVINANITKLSCDNDNIRKM